MGWAGESWSWTRKQERQDEQEEKTSKSRVRSSVTDDDGARRDAKEMARVHKANAEDGEEESGKDRRKGGKEERTDELEGREARRRKRELGWALKGRV